MLSRRFQTTLPEPFESVSRELDRVFSDFAREPAGSSARTAPVALWEDDQQVYLDVEVPGLRQDDLDVTIHEGRLIIAGERKPVQRGQKCWYNELTYGRFERVIALSEMIDPESIEAELEHGMLHLTLRKKPESQPHRVAIQVRNGTVQPKLGESEPAAQT